MRMQIDDSALKVEGDRADEFMRLIKAGAATRLMVSAQYLVERVKTEMPVDTGRARNSWATPQSEGVWEVSEDDLSVLQGSTVHYIQRLNEGHSQQAPAGFIDAATESAIDLLLEGLTTVSSDVLMGALPSMLTMLGD